MLPQEIEQTSFQIIQSEIGAHSFSPAELAIVTRVIHATADFDFREHTRFHPQAIFQGIAALRRGCTIVADVRMLEVGVNSATLSRFGGQIVCAIQDPGVRQAAGEQGLTRSTLAMRHHAQLLEGGIAAIGNAPTALMEVLRLVGEEGIRPALIVGVPVGFVNAAESKQELLRGDVPYITALGRKGGSTVAVAILNALLRLAETAAEAGA